MEKFCDSLADQVGRCLVRVSAAAYRSGCHRGHSCLTPAGVGLVCCVTTAALVEVLERKGVLTRQEVLGMIQALRQ